MKPFQFKQFEVHQEKNPQKIGTDSMLLGAWTAEQMRKRPQRILDIGTGTGILTLMMAQKFAKAQLTAIEPQVAPQIEANENFKNSPFTNRILCIQTSLQQFGSMEKFDLIICNPPYFDGTYLSSSSERNKARHQDDLPTHEIYECAAELLNEGGFLSVIVPYQSETEHIERAFDNELYLKKVLHTITPSGTKKRSLLLFSFEEKDPTVESMLIKDAKGYYSEAYIQLTQDFYAHDLAAKQKSD